MLKLFLTASTNAVIQQSNKLKELPMLWKADIDNHNKDGGLWIIIHDKVYDVLDFR
jgi:cytochrome b involved in lipid metabolism